MPNPMQSPEALHLNHEIRQFAKKHGVRTLLLIVAESIQTLGALKQARRTPERHAQYTDLYNCLCDLALGDATPQ